MATPIKWNEANFKWNDNPHTWDEVQLVVEVVEALGGGGVIEEDMPWMKSQDTKKRLVKLICKVQGKTIKEEKEIQDYKIKVSDIKLLAEKVLGIEVLTENIKF
tara:strand:+ start:647 stop:958 length:312 start_codon:yes stop_codon:yes gene_type:complete